MGDQICSEPVIRHAQKMFSDSNLYILTHFPRLFSHLDIPTYTYDEWQGLEEAYLNGHKENRLPHTTNISFKHVEGEGLLMGFNKNIALSSGSACTSASLEPSYVLKALGLGDDLAHSSLRFGLGRFTTEEQIDYTIKAISDTVNKLREMSPLWEMFKEGIDLNSIEWAHH